MEKRRLKSCLQFEGLLWYTTRTLIMYLSMWRKLEVRCPERHLTAAGIGHK
jgi:hypothetical protein